MIGKHKQPWPRRNAELVRRCSSGVYTSVAALAWDMRLPRPCVTAQLKALRLSLCPPATPPAPAAMLRPAPAAERPPARNNHGELPRGISTLEPLPSLLQPLPQIGLQL